MQKCDIAIIGAGPAGSAAAIEAASAGLRIVLVDKSTFPRDKCCGDGLTTAALRELHELGLERAKVSTWTPAQDLWLTAPSGWSRHFPLRSDAGQFAAIAERRELDAGLVQLARDSGATVVEGEALNEIELFEDRVEIATTGQRICANHVIGADGVWSPTRRALGLHQRGYRGDSHGFRQYFENVSVRASSGLFVWFEPEILPGYLWSFPLPGGRANVGYGIRRGAGIPIKEMSRLWGQLLARPHIRQVLGPNAAPEGRHWAWPIPARLGELPLAHHRIMFAGDAAASCDPLTGEGIGQALWTGRTAARSVLGGGNPFTIAQRYRRAVERELGFDMRFAGALSGCLGTQTSAELALRAAGMNRWTRTNFARWLFEDYPRATIATPRRWYRFANSSTGAFADLTALHQAPASTAYP